MNTTLVNDSSFADLPQIKLRQDGSSETPSWRVLSTNLHCAKRSRRAGSTLNSVFGKQSPIDSKRGAQRAANHLPSSM